MAGLLDIAPLSETVMVRGTPVTVTGLSAASIAALLFRFPTIRAAMSGREVTMEALAATGPDAIAAIIAAGTGAAEDPAAESVARGLLADEAADLLEAILRISLPRGVGPLVERLAALGAIVGGPSPSAPASR